ncbi:CdaR family protein [Bradyrhizobium quebecense]|uniref:CdaR family protein n=1 Tax=Bradyrhizobium quebecense TaxID=2748629 RepID=UPI003B849114
MVAPPSAPATFKLPKVNAPAKLTDATVGDGLVSPAVCAPTKLPPARPPSKVSATGSTPDTVTVGLTGPSSRIVRCEPTSAVAVADWPKLSVTVAVSVTRPDASVMPSLKSPGVPS